MKVIIIEDEHPAANRLTKLLLDLNQEIELVKRLDSIESSLQFLGSEPEVDLIFMDIQLADGLCFQIFEQVKVNTPVIFTTAFDQYTLKAFKVNSVDYLLKPIEEEELKQAIQKFQSLRLPKEEDYSGRILKLIKDINPIKYKERLLIKSTQELSYLKTLNIAYCFATGKFSFAVDFKGNQFLLDQNLSELEADLNPAVFYRINRNLIVNIEALQKVHLWFGGRLKIDLTLSTTADTVVSRDRVAGFKEWLGGK